MRQCVSLYSKAPHSSSRVINHITIVFVHFYSAPHSMSLSEALLNTAIDTVSKFTCQSTIATVSEGLAQSPYVVAKVGFEPTTLRSKGINSTNVPPCPQYH